MPRTLPDGILLDIPDINVTITPESDLKVSVQPADSYNTVLVTTPDTTITRNLNVFVDFAASASQATSAISSSYAVTASYISNTDAVASSSYSLTSSFSVSSSHAPILGNGSGLFFTTLNTSQSSNSTLIIGNIYDNYLYRQDTIFTNNNVSILGDFTVSNDGVVFLQPHIEPPTVVGGNIYYSSSGFFHFQGGLESTGILSALTVLSNNISAASITGSLFGTGSWALNAVTASYALDSNVLITTNTQTSDYTLVLADKDQIVEMNSGSAITVTVPPNSSVEFPFGTRIMIARGNIGSVQIITGSGVTINSPNNNTYLQYQYSIATLVKKSTDEWWMFGDLSSS